MSDETGAPSGGSKQTPPDAMVSGVASAYYAREIGAPDAARERAQRAYTIAGAVATVLLAAGALSDLTERSPLVQVAGLVAIALWIVSFGLFVRAVAVPVRRVERESGLDEEKFVRTALDRALEEREEIDGRLVTALVVSAVAGLATAVAVALAIFVKPETKEIDDATVVLTQQGAQRTTAACGRQVPTTLKADVDKDSLQQEYVVLHLPAPSCGSDETEVRLPRDEVVAVRE